MLVNEAYGTFIKAREREESDSESISNNEDNSSGSINNLTGKKISLLEYSIHFCFKKYIFKDINTKIEHQISTFLLV